MRKVKSYLKAANPSTFALRFGLAFVFLYAGIESLLHPLEWSGFLPSFTGQVMNPTLALQLIAIGDIAIALWLISGRLTKYAAALTALLLAGIILTSLNQFIVTFRDVGLLGAALALVFLDASPPTRPRQR